MRDLAAVLYTVACSPLPASPVPAHPYPSCPQASSSTACRSGIAQMDTLTGAIHAAIGLVTSIYTRIEILKEEVLEAKPRKRRTSALCWRVASSSPFAPTQIWRGSTRCLGPLSATHGALPGASRVRRSLSSSSKRTDCKKCPPGLAENRGQYAFPLAQPMLIASNPA